MKLIIRFILTISLILQANAYQVKDSLGQIFEFEKTPNVISLTPSITESIYFIGAQDNLLANSRYCKFPEEAKNKSKVGGLLDPNYEKIIELKPDIVILPNMVNKAINDKLNTFGIKCFIANKESLYNIIDDLKILAKLFDKSVDDKIYELENKFKHIKKYKGKAFFMFGNMAAGKGSYVGDMLDELGLDNCAKLAKNSWAILDKEYILTSDVEFLFVELKSSQNKKDLIKYYKTDAIWQKSKAVKNDNIFFINSDDISIPGPRIISTLLNMQNYMENSSKKIK